MPEATSPPIATPSVSLLGQLLLLAALIAALFAADVFLRNIERKEVRIEAQHFFNEGSRLLVDGHAAAAAESLRSAYSLLRDNRQYALALSTALMESGKFDEAQKLISELLARDSNDGEANLIAARLDLQRGDFQQAQSEYHRAIYGSWSGPDASAPADSRRVAVRLELADLLASRHQTKDLLAELLPLETEAQSQPELRLKIARLYLDAESPARAASAARAILNDQPGNAAAYAIIGEADLASGNYGAAVSAFSVSERNSPQTADTVSKRLELASAMAALDPTPRQLTSAEKYHRSMRIVQLARYALARCSPSQSALVAQADKTLASKARGVPTNELAEERLALADQLWQARDPGCDASQPPSEEPLRLIMEKLDQ